MIGIDEVGRGSWAGPLVVCAARLRQPVIGLVDSKILTRQKRLQLNAIIAKHADIGLGWVSADEIDDIGLSSALKVATAKALLELTVEHDEQIIIDGTVSFIPDYPNCTMVPKGDQTVPAVSAASIVAKVARDKRMYEYAKQYPEYYFENNVGYGTMQHRAAILQYGTVAIHRSSFRLPQ